MTTRISAKGRVTLPRKVCAALRVGPGDRVQFAFNGGGEIVVNKAPPEVRPSGRARNARHQGEITAVTPHDFDQKGASMGRGRHFQAVNRFQRDVDA